MRYLLFTLALLSTCSWSLADEMPKVGDTVPEFLMQGSDGKTYQADQFIDKQAFIIAWFPRAFTGGCTKECKSMKTSGELLKKFDVAYFTASTDPVNKNTEFAKSLDLDYPILSDPDGLAAQAFGVLRPDGKAANRVTFIVGKDGKILSVDDKVATESHGEDLAKRLEQLGVAKK